MTDCTDCCAAAPTDIRRHMGGAPSARKRKKNPTGDEFESLCVNVACHVPRYTEASWCSQSALFMRRSVLLYFTTATVVNYLKVVLPKVVLSAAQSTFSPQPSSACLPKSNSPPAGLSTSCRQHRAATFNLFQHGS